MCDKILLVIMQRKNTALKLAVKAQRKLIVKILIKSGAFVDEVSSRIFISH